MELRMIPITEMNPAPYNPRKNLKPEDAEYQHIKNSIDTFGYVDPIIWNERTGNIVGGHQRFKILVAGGAKEIECSIVDYDTTFEKAANAALNKAQGIWDLPSLEDLLDGLKELNFDMIPYGFDTGDFNMPEENKSINEEDMADTKNKCPKCGFQW